jgi:N-acetylneuraminic acid mutarotase
VRRLLAALATILASCTTASDVDRPTTSGATTPLTSTTAAPAGWVELAPMETARSEHPAVVLDNEIVVLGGLVEAGVGRTGVTPSVEAYAPATDTWRQLPELPEARHHGMAAVVGGRLFFIGGYDASGAASSAVWELVDGTWRDSQPLPVPVAAAAAVATGDAIYLVGGVPDGLFHRYDVASNSWSALTPPATQREHVAAAIVDGEVWAIAGRWMGEIFDTTEAYDPASESWREGPSLIEPRSGFGAAVIGGTIIVAGGEVFDPDEALTSVERLNSEPDGWFSIDSLAHGLHGNPLVAVGSDVYLPGGSTRPAGVANDGEVYRLTVG